MGAVQSPVVYHNVFRKTRHDAKDALVEARYHLEAEAALEWVPDRETFDLHRCRERDHDFERGPNAAALWKGVR